MSVERRLVLALLATLATLATPVIMFYGAMGGMDPKPGHHSEVQVLVLGVVSLGVIVGWVAIALWCAVIAPAERRSAVSSGPAPLRSGQFLLLLGLVLTASIPASVALLKLEADGAILARDLADLLPVGLLIGVLVGPPFLTLGLMRRARWRKSQQAAPAF
jgi:hypothetical protein